MKKKEKKPRSQKQTYIDFGIGLDLYRTKKQNLGLHGGITLSCKKCPLCVTSL